MDLHQKDAFPIIRSDKVISYGGTVISITGMLISLKTEW